MAFKIPASKKSDAANRFEFEDADGNTHSIPLLKFAPVETAEAFEDNHNMADILAACDNDASRKVIRGMDGDVFSAFMTAWSEASGIEPGESSASSAS